MGHELFSNMREGNWMLDYQVKRLDTFMNDELSRVIHYLNDFVIHVKSLNPSFRPKYGSRVLEKLYNAALFDLVNHRMNDNFVHNSSDVFT